MLASVEQPLDLGCLVDVVAVLLTHFAEGLHADRQSAPDHAPILPPRAGRRESTVAERLRGDRQPAAGHRGPASGTRGRHRRARPRPHAPNNPDDASNGSVTRVACASHAGLICPVTRAIKAAALRLVPLVVIAEAPGIGYGNADCRIHFWCTRGRSKVDFVLYRADGFHAIQVTTAARCGPPTSGASRHSTATPPPPSTASCSSCLPP